ncbi:hypothetical protein HDU85_002298 [Gaertneriomyces sp. JEL0708]|nr:hypothetical protein HDU85_002298 [Gaertneriomyces sp. JEL0708]
MPARPPTTGNKSIGKFFLLGDLRSAIGLSPCFPEIPAKKWGKLQDLTEGIPATELVSRNPSDVLSCILKDFSSLGGTVYLSDAIRTHAVSCLQYLRQPAARAALLGAIQERRDSLLFQNEENRKKRKLHHEGQLAGYELITKKVQSIRQNIDDSGPSRGNRSSLDADDELDKRQEEDHLTEEALPDELFADEVTSIPIWTDQDEGVTPWVRVAEAEVARMRHNRETNGVLWKRILILSEETQAKALEKGDHWQSLFDQTLRDAIHQEFACHLVVEIKRFAYARAVAAVIRSTSTPHLKRIGDGMGKHGRNWALSQLANAMGSRPGFSCSGEKWSQEQIADMCDDECVADALRLLQRVIRLIEIRANHPSNNTERDTDIRFNGQFVETIWPQLNFHFGEAESRASRERRIRALQALNSHATIDDVRGAYCDFLFTDDTIGLHSGWGKEFGAAANVGAKRDNLKKIVADKNGLLTLLRDQHYALGEDILATGGSMKALRRLIVPGLLINNWTYRLFVLGYLRNGFHAAKEIAAFQVPMALNNSFPSLMGDLLLGQLRFKTVLYQAHDTYLHYINTEDRSEDGDVEANTDWVPPDHLRTPNSKRRP